MDSNVSIFLSILNKFRHFFMKFDRPTSIIAFGGKMKIVTFFKQLDIGSKAQCFSATSVQMKHILKGNWAGVTQITNC